MFHVTGFGVYKPKDALVSIEMLNVLIYIFDDTQPIRA